MTERKRSIKTITPELGVFLGLWTLAFFLLAGPFRSMELAPCLVEALWSQRSQL